ncbi:MAG: nucleoside-diphosphate sugar epimerase/dehydratase [Parvibaculum sp.]|nr:nucleoside-diphosphate sugar epimerase/dehydratase [Parvibaculum sp.]
MFKIAPRTACIFAFDLLLASVSLPLAALLRLNWERFLSVQPILVEMTIVFTAVSFVVLLFARLHRVAWRFISVNDALLITSTVAAINVIFLTIMFMWIRLDGVPRAIIPINIFVLTSTMIGSRLVLRLWHERRVSKSSMELDGQKAAYVLLIGATDAAEAFILTNLRDHQKTYRVIGVLDSGQRPKGSLIRGVSVIGSVDELDEKFAFLTRRGMRPDIFVVADQKVRGEALQQIVDVANAHAVRLFRLPDANELRRANHPPAMRPIELEELLSRSEAQLDHFAMLRLIGGKNVLVTGAGGSIGSELVKQIAALSPDHITLVEMSEFNLYEIDRYLAGRFPHISRSALIADVRDESVIQHIFEKQSPEIVFHAAALKHVPLLEDQPSQAVLTNIKGTRNVADACVAFNVETMVMVSSDKAAHPVSIMGATKRLAESYCQSLDLEVDPTKQTRFITVRFGNVLGSAGSVVPLFQKQLAEGGPITVTHRSMTRYFMTIREAVQLVLQAGTLNYDELERGRIVVLDMGEPINILDMATQLIKLAGLRPYKDIEIVFTGLRPGERLTESLFQADEELVGTSYDGLQIANAKVGGHAFVRRLVDQLILTASSHNDDAVKDLLDVAISDFATRRAVMHRGEDEHSAAQHSEI